MLQATEPTAPAPEVALLTAAAERFFHSAHRATGEELALDLPAVSRCLSLIQLKFSEMAAAFAQTNEYDVQGSYSPIRWIRVNCHIASNTATETRVWRQTRLSRCGLGSFGARGAERCRRE